MSTHVEVRGLAKSFPQRNSRQLVHAVRDVSFSIERGQTLGLVGESGSGKSTIGRCLLRLTEPTQGSVVVGGKDLANLGKKALRQERSRIQMIFQDPYESLNPRMRIGRILEEPLMLHTRMTPTERRRRCVDLMEMVRLDSAFLDRFPHGLSGGQLQRVGIARALATDPHFLVLDEPTSSLDLSVRAGVLDLIARLSEELGITSLFISHDISTVARMADQVATLYLGEIVEVGPAEQVLRSPQHPYTQALLSASLPIYRTGSETVRHMLTGEPPSPVDVPVGCVFTPRCPVARDDCAPEKPAMFGMPDGRKVACVRVPDGSNLLVGHPAPSGAGPGAQGTKEVQVGE